MPSTRRQFTSTLATLTALAPLMAKGAEKASAVKIGACDWSLKMPSPEVFGHAASMGLDGIQVTFSQPGEQWDLRRRSVQQTYVEAAEKHQVHIASLGMGILNKRPYCSVPESELWVADGIQIASKMGIPVMLLAFFGKADLKGDAEGTAEVIRRLKRVAPLAEEKGVILGLETMLDIDEHLQILDAVGSPAVQVYYDTGNSHRAGNDIYAEIEALGVDRICEFHAKDPENGKFGEGAIDFPRVRNLIAEMGFAGWIQIEGKLDAAEFKQNGAYLRQLFSE